MFFNGGSCALWNYRIVLKPDGLIIFPIRPASLFIGINDVPHRVKADSFRNRQFLHGHSMHRVLVDDVYPLGM